MEVEIEWQSAFLPSASDPTGSAAYLLMGTASTFSMTRVSDPLRSNTFPLAITFCPVNFIRREFCPVAGIALEIGQEIVPSSPRITRGDRLWRRRARNPC